MRLSKPVDRWMPMPSDPTVELLIHHLSPGEIQDIVDSTISERMRYEADGDGNVRPVLESERNAKADREATLKAAVRGWRGEVYDADGNPLEFSEAALMEAARTVPYFMGDVSKMRARLKEDIDNEQRGQEKN